MDKATGKPFMIGGMVFTAETEFVAKETSGTVTLEYSFDTKNVGSFDVVVFEELYVVRDINGKKTEIVVGTHKDINDKNQTVSIHTVPVTGDKLPLVPIVAIFIVSIISIVLIIHKKKKLHIV